MVDEDRREAYERTDAEKNAEYFRHELNFMTHKVVELKANLKRAIEIAEIFHERAGNKLHVKELQKMKEGL